ncbi:hypothetical protein GCM10011418_36310 [Sphingobacterium alkalisoli]|uniref:hypothetical protein n=1 Tax=Sphingobacterium alkalisoli TaxID=1874115 RepID=UPI0019C3E1A7|nr:hypothetical protein [Sphingobacterium alkalisoli]GGH26801.1 hypothetical protein GCM10011418_36310 [Sphingobacterium alkalisoli]
MEINKEHELNILTKIFSIIKYKIIDDRTSELAVSPITTELFNRVIEDFAPLIEKRGGVLKYGYIEDSPEELNAIKYHLSNIESWETLDNQVRKSVIVNLVCPYEIREDTLEEASSSDSFVSRSLSENKYLGFNVKERVYVSDFVDDFVQAIIEKDTDRITKILRDVERDEKSIKAILNSLSLS